MQIEVVQGDIVDQRVDAIVNAANQTLLGGGGVDGAIHRAAGHGCWQPAGYWAAATLAMRKRPLALILHVAGLSTPSDPFGLADREGRRRRYRRALEVADQLGAKSVAFPAISTGAFGFPEAEAAVIAVRTLRSATTAVQLVRLVAFDRHTSRLLEREVEKGADRPSGS